MGTLFLVAVALLAANGLGLIAAPWWVALAPLAAWLLGVVLLAWLGKVALQLEIEMRRRDDIGSSRF